MMVVKYFPNPFTIGGAFFADVALLTGYFRAAARSEALSIRARSEAGYP